jgi:hypothetical protein
MGEKRSFAKRLLGAACLDASTYEEVEADHSANPQALLAVVLTSVAAGVGSAHATDSTNLLLRVVAALLAWAVWAAVTYFVGVHLMPEPETRSDIGELLRTLGFASAPRLASVLGRVPLFGVGLVWLVELWLLAAMVVAVRQALDYRSTMRAVGVCLIGFVLTRGLVLALFFLGAVSSALS